MPRPPTDAELGIRIRKWVQHYWRQAERGGLDRQKFAESIDLSGATISNLLNDREVGGLATLVRLHYHLGADLREMVRQDPPAVSGEQPARK